MLVCRALTAWYCVVL